MRIPHLVTASILIAMGFEVAALPQVETIAKWNRDGR